MIEIIFLQFIFVYNIWLRESDHKFIGKTQDVYIEGSIITGHFSSETLLYLVMIIFTIGFIVVVSSYE